MKREKGIAYCGLACCICSQNINCAGCRNNGCIDKDWCKNRNCCREKGIIGCWECIEFPCLGGMLDKRKPRVFAKFAAKFGEEKLMDYLAQNENFGKVYHYENQIIGDYDQLKTDEELFELIINGT